MEQDSNLRPLSAQPDGRRLHAVKVFALCVLTHCGGVREWNSQRGKLTQLQPPNHPESRRKIANQWRGNADS